MEEEEIIKSFGEGLRDTLRAYTLYNKLYSFSDSEIKLYFDILKVLKLEAKAGWGGCKIDISRHPLTERVLDIFKLSGLRVQKESQNIVLFDWSR